MPNGQAFHGSPPHLLSREKNRSDETFRLSLHVAFQLVHPSLDNQRNSFMGCDCHIEDYHMCLKTGCRMEDCQLDDGDDLKRLLGFTAPIAVRLLQLRQVVRTAPETPAITAATLDPLMVHVLAAKFHLAASSLTVKMFWTLVAQLGGYLGRNSDGPPGWRTLWKGWRHLADWVEGVRLLAPEKSG
jgi:hypothetical protein